MYNTKFILSDGKEIYPGYLDIEKRKELKKQFGGKREFLRCGCKRTGLFYRISEDFKIYPEHNNYVHNQSCSRYRNPEGKSERKTGYLINEEDGTVTAYLTFDPKNMSIAEDVDKVENNPESDKENQEEIENEAVVEKETQTVKEDKKEPNLTIDDLIRSINTDTFTERIMNGQKIDSREKFSKNVYFRMKKIKASRMKKGIGELTIENDGVRFVYVPFAGAMKKEEKGLKKCYFCNYGPDGTIYNNFIFPEVMEKAIKNFVKRYGAEPNQDTMMAGFQYRKNTKSGRNYLVLGRVHLFQVSAVGIYCRSLIEKETFDLLNKVMEEDQDVKYWIPPDDESIGGIVQIKGKKKKIIILFRKKKDEYVTFDESLYEPLAIGNDEILTKEKLYEIIKKLK